MVKSSCTRVASYKGGSDVREHMHIETFKKELSWDIDKWLRLIINTMLVIPVRIRRIKPFFILKNFVCVVM